MKSTTLPNSWCEATFEDVLADISNGISDSQNKEAEGIPVSRIETIATGKINLAKIGYVSNISESAAERYLLNPGDVLFSHINSPAHIGKTAIFRSGRLYHGTNLLRLRTQRDACAPEYFEYYCRYYRSIGEFSMNAQHAVNQSSLNQKKIKAFTLPLPPLAEQTRIAQKLDELLAQVDTLKARIDAIPALLKRFRQSVLAAAVSGRLTEEWRATGISSRNEENASYQSTEVQEPWSHTIEAPASWTLYIFEDVIKLVGGSQPPKSQFTYEEAPGLVRLIQIRDYKSDKHKVFISRDATKKFCSADDIMIGRYGPPIFQILRGLEGAYNVALMKSVPRAEVLKNEYMYWYLQNYKILNFVEAGSDRTAGQSGVNKAFLEKYPIYLPTLTEQTEIVRRVEQLFAVANQLEAKVASAKSHIDYLTQSILAKAFRGELVPQDPSDELASVLLERIQAQRAAAPKAKRGRKST